MAKQPVVMLKPFAAVEVAMPVTDNCESEVVASVDVPVTTSDPEIF
mgnify:CR=1 FL=1